MSSPEPAERRTDEAIKLVSDWGKWLITVELAMAAAIGVLFSSSQAVPNIPTIARIFGTVTVGSFLVSIVAAAIMLITLSEIMQRRRSDENIWHMKDSILRVRTEALALSEAIFFGIGIISACGMILSLIWR